MTQANKLLIKGPLTGCLTPVADFKKLGLVEDQEEQKCVPNIYESSG